MSDEPKAMREIHEIRLKIYEEIKDMSPQECTEYFRRAGARMAKKYGIRVKDETPELHDIASR